MKSTVLVLCLLVWASQAAAFQTVCKDIAKMAVMIMMDRQAGTAKSDVITKLDPQSPVYGPFKEMILQAFKQPRYKGAEQQKRAITDFGSQYLTSCEIAAQKKG